MNNVTIPRTNWIKVRGFVTITGILILSGCAPFASYEHLSMPNVNDDGYDLGCLGVESDRQRVVFEGAICENFARGDTDTFAKLNVKLRLGAL